MKTILITLLITLFNWGGENDLVKEKPECRVTVTITYVDVFGREQVSTASGGNLFTSCSKARAIAEERAFSQMF